MKHLALLAFIVGCSSSSVTEVADATQELGDLHYAPPPSNWSHRDTKETTRLVSRWTPNENPNKESISIIRTTARTDVKAASPTQLEVMLVEAQRSLPAPSVLEPTIGKTKQNLQEFDIAADFVPTGLHDSYHRVHAMIVDGDIVVHVLYTARTADPSLAMFRQVVDSIRRGEG